MSPPKLPPKAETVVEFYERLLRRDAREGTSESQRKRERKEALTAYCVKSGSL
jgi:hypothetical protein